MRLQAGPVEAGMQVAVVAAHVVVSDDAGEGEQVFIEIEAILRRALREKVAESVDVVTEALRQLVQEEQQHAERLVTRTPKEPQLARVAGSGRS